MEAEQLIGLVLRVSIVLTVLGFALQTTPRDVRHLFERPGLLLRSLAAMFVIMPVVALALAVSFDVRPSARIVLVALAISPVPPLLPHKEGKAGGHAGYAVGLMALVSLLAIAVVPLELSMVGLYLNRPLSTPGDLAQIVVAMTLLPLAVGLAVRAFAPTAANRLARPVGFVANLLLGAGVAVILVAALPSALALIGDGTLIAMLVFVGVGLGVGHALAYPAPEEQTVLALSTATRHPAIALAIARANFPDEPHLGAAVLLYLVVAAIVAAPYVARQRHIIAAVHVTRHPGTT